MAKVAPSGGNASALEAQVGRRLWGPPEEAERSADRRTASLRYQAVLLVAMALVAFVAAASSAAPGSYDLSTALMLAGGLLALLASWLFFRATREGGFTLGVYERGVLLPSSFESAPGLATMGGPVFIRTADVDRVEEMRSGGERAVVVWSRAGRSGIVSLQPEGSRLPPEQAEALLDDLLGELKKRGFGSRAASDVAEEE